MPLPKIAHAVSLAVLQRLASPVVASLRVIFSPTQLKYAFASSMAASSLIGFGVAFLSTLGSEAAANPQAGIAGGVVSFVLLRIASRLAELEAGKVPSAPASPVELAGPPVFIQKVDGKPFRFETFDGRPVVLAETVLDFPPA